MTRIDITLGLITTIATVAIIAVVGLGEERRMEQAARAFDVRSVERGAQMFDQYCADCHGVHAVGGMCPPLDETSGLHGGSLGEGVAWRLDELGWDRSDPYGYVYSVIEGGRQISTRPWRWSGNRVAPDDLTTMAMPAWGRDYNGPLRPDQIKDLANFIVSFEDNLPDTAEEAIDFNAGIEGKVSIFDAPDANPRPDGSDPAALGEWLFTGTLACATCHVYEGVSNPIPATGPELTDIATVAADRIDLDDYAGEASTALEYIRESIVSPSAHVVEGFDDGLMPATFGTLPEEDLDALVTFLAEGPSTGEDGDAGEADADADDADAEGAGEGDGTPAPGEDGDTDAGEDAVIGDDEDEDGTGTGGNDEDEDDAGSASGAGSGSGATPTP